MIRRRGGGGGWGSTLGERVYERGEFGVVTALRGFNAAYIFRILFSDINPTLDYTVVNLGS